MGGNYPYQIPVLGDMLFYISRGGLELEYGTLIRAYVYPDCGEIIDSGHEICAL